MITQAERGEDSSDRDKTINSFFPCFSFFFFNQSAQVRSSCTGWILPAFLSFNLASLRGAQEEKKCVFGRAEPGLLY